MKCVPAFLTMFVIAFSLPLSACGGSGSSEEGVASVGGDESPGASAPTGKGTLDPQTAQLKYAQCMRANGVSDFPDPGSPDENRGVEVTATFEKAAKICLKWRQASSNYVDPLDPKVLDAKTRYAQCMRERGMKVHDPDRKTGTYQVEVDPKDRARFEAAVQECRHFLPQGES
jgi:hypothetical protein